MKQNPECVHVVLEVVRNLIPQSLYCRSKFVASKNDVKITSEHDAPCGKIRFNISPNQCMTVKIEVENCGTNEIMLERYRLRKRCEFIFVVSKQSLPVKLPPGNTCLLLLKHC